MTTIGIHVFSFGVCTGCMPCQNMTKGPKGNAWQYTGTFAICHRMVGSMYGIYTYIYHKFQLLHVGNYAIHGAYENDNNKNKHFTINIEWYTKEEWSNSTLAATQIFTQRSSCCKCLSSTYLKRDRVFRLYVQYIFLTICHFQIVFSQDSKCAVSQKDVFVEIRTVSVRHGDCA